jgi:hypothetical protein
MPGQCIEKVNRKANGQNTSQITTKSQHYATLPRVSADTTQHFQGCHQTHSKTSKGGDPNSKQSTTSSHTIGLYTSACRRGISYCNFFNKNYQTNKQNHSTEYKYKMRPYIHMLSHSNMELTRTVCKGVLNHARRHPPRGP